MAEYVYSYEYQFAGKWQHVGRVWDLTSDAADAAAQHMCKLADDCQYWPHRLIRIRLDD